MRRRGRQRDRRVKTRLLLQVGALVAVLIGAAWATDTLRRAELWTLDARFELRGTLDTPRDLLVVAVDDATFDELDEQWPFPRSMHAEVIDRLRAGGARVIAYDVQFTEPTTEREDGALLDAVAEAGNVVLAATEVDEQGGTKVLGGEETLREVGARAGNAIMPADPGGIIRRVSHSVQGLESFAVAAAERATGRQVQPFGSRTIDYHGPPGAVPTVSFVDVLEGRVPADALRGRVVVVGASAPSLQDVSATSTSGDEVMAGAEIQASAISTVLRGFPLRDTGWVPELALVLLMAAVAPLAHLRLPAVRALGVAVGAGAAYLAIGQIAFEQGLILPMLYPLAALATASVGSLAVDYVTESFERERVRDAFARFVPVAVVDRVVSQAGDALTLGGTRMDCTLLFSDLRGFTSYSEGQDPERVITVLNRYLTEMSEAILCNGGTLVSYMGDGIMAVFGAPLEQPDHADRALLTARDMLARLEGFNEWMRAEGYGDGFRMGIGLNSGPVMSGNVGSERRMDYTTIGDTVNTAARLEGMTKGTPFQVYVAGSTHGRLAEPPLDLVYVDELEVRGRREPIGVWGLVEKGAAEPAGASSPAGLTPA